MIEVVRTVNYRKLSQESWSQVSTRMTIGGEREARRATGQKEMKSLSIRTRSELRAVSMVTRVRADVYGAEGESEIWRMGGRPPEVEFSI